jgi:hypothetical protein
MLVAQICENSGADAVVCAISKYAGHQSAKRSLHPPFPKAMTFGFLR